MNEDILPVLTLDESKSFEAETNASYWLRRSPCDLNVRLFNAARTPFTLVEVWATASAVELKALEVAAPLS